MTEEDIVVDNESNGEEVESANTEKHLLTRPSTSNQDLILS